MSLLHYLITIYKSALDLTLTLFKVIIPIIIIIKILDELGFIILLSEYIAPLMEIVGLPGAMGLVWATSIMTSLYGGMVVYASLASDISLSVAQVTVLTTMMLVAHGLPIEGRVAQKAGVNFGLTLFFRMSMALVLGAILNQFYSSTGWLQGESILLWTSSQSDASLFTWVQNQLLSLLIIFIMIFALVLLLDVLKKIGFIQVINQLLRPVLHLLGIGREAETITLVGFTLGLSYGGALLIKEAEAGQISHKNVLYSISLLGLSHGLIEDTLLMLLIGGHLSGILLARILFSLLSIFLLVKLVENLPELFIKKYMVKSVAN